MYPLLPTVATPVAFVSEMEMGQWVKWVTILDGWVTWVMSHCQWPIDPWWWNNCVVAWNFNYLLLVLTHSISSIIIPKGLILIYDFLLSNPRGLSSTTMPRPLLVPYVEWNDVIAMGHGSIGYERWSNSISDLCELTAWMSDAASHMDRSMSTSVYSAPNETGNYSIETDAGHLSSTAEYQLNMNRQLNTTPTGLLKEVLKG